MVEAFLRVRVCSTMDFVSPSGYLRAVAARKKSEAFAAWKSELPDQWIESFITCGVKPFLTKHGYVLGFSESQTVAYCKQWAFAFLSKGTVELVDSTNTASLVSEEYEWYQDTISILEWNEFAKVWHAPEFLDSSDAGKNQLDELNRFVWHCIYLEGSPAHLAWLESLEEEENPDQPWVAEDMHAYGGDRRTY